MGKIIISNLSHGYPIQPKHIDANNHFWEAFGNKETEVSANWIVRLCQKRSGWFPFTDEQIERFYQEGGFRGFKFNKLLSEGWIIKNDGYYCITHGFISRCFLSSPCQDCFVINT